MGIFKAPRATTAERMTITPEDGELIYDTDLKVMFQGDNSTVGGIGANDASWGAVVGTLADQLDLQAALDLKAEKAQAADTETVYTDDVTALEYKIYVTGGNLVMEEL